MATWSNIDMLPKDCISAILSYTSPPEACRCSLVSSTFRSAVESDTLWHTFLPSDYEDIVSRAVIPLKFSSKKELFYGLCHSLLIDGGNKSFKLDKSSGKKSYILSARELSVEWSNDPLFWSWRSMPESKFAVAAELRSVSWLEIKGQIRTRILTPNTRYGAYLIMNVSQRAYGLDSAASEVSVEVGNRVQRGRAYLFCKDENKNKMESLFYGHRRDMMRETMIQEDVGVPSKREDGWMEIELGQFFSGEDDEVVKMSLREAGYQLKGGLILEGIEVRPRTAGEPIAWMHGKFSER